VTIPREYVHAALLGITAVLIILGIAVFYSAASFEGHIAGVMLLALAGCSYSGARELKAKLAKPAAAAPAEPGPTEGNEP